MVAIKKFHEDIAHFLLENGADIHLYNEDGWSCLNLAIFYRLKKVFVDIINLGPNVNHCTNVSCTLFIFFSKSLPIFRKGFLHSFQLARMVNQILWIF